MTSVAQITTFFSNKGGVERAVRDLSRGLVTKNFDVTVVCTENENDQIVPLTGANVVSASSAISVAGRPLALGLAKKLNALDCDIVHFHLPFPLATFCWQPTRQQTAERLTIATWHHDIGRYPFFQKLYEPQLRTFLKSVDRILVTSPHAVAANPVLQSFESKCSVVPLGVDSTRFEHGNIEATEDFKRKIGGRFVLFVGRLVYYKGCEILLRAMQHVDASVVLVGDGPLRTDLEALAAELGISEKVIFAGRTSDEDLVSYYQACEMLVLPSTLPTECFGLVQVEAMLSGKPVINTNLNTGVAWVSKHGETGLTVPIGEASALGEAIATLLADETKRTNFGQNARARALKEFTLDRHINNTASLYETLLSEKRQCLVAQ